MKPSPRSRSFFINNNPLRDGLARIAAAEGDFDGAIAIYEKLNDPHGERKWTSAFEPRYVLEVARLHAAAGRKEAARKAYARFLELWKDADSELPELAEARAFLAG